MLDCRLARSARPRARFRLSWFRSRLRVLSGRRWVYRKGRQILRRWPLLNISSADRVTDDPAKQHCTSQDPQEEQSEHCHSSDSAITFNGGFHRAVPRKAFLTSMLLRVSTPVKSQFDRIPIPKERRRRPIMHFEKARYLLHTSPATEDWEIHHRDMRISRCYSFLYSRIGIPTERQNAGSFPRAEETTQDHRVDSAGGNGTRTGLRHTRQIGLAERRNPGCAQSRSVEYALRPVVSSTNSWSGTAVAGGFSSSAGSAWKTA